MKKEPIAKKFFRTYFLWILLFVSLILCSSVLYAVHSIRDSITRTQKQLTLSVNQNIENYFQEMDEFSMSLIQSEDFRRIVTRELPETYEENRNTAELFGNLYLDAHQMIQKNYRVGVVLDSGYYIWLGNEYYIDCIQEDPDAYEDYAWDGSARIQYLERNEYLQASRGSRRVSDEDKPMITLSRSFGNNSFLYNGSCILEVQVDAEEFKKDMKRLLSEESGDGLDLHLMNQDGEDLLDEPDWDGKIFLDTCNWEKGSFRRGNDYVYVYPLFHSGIYAVYTISIFAYYKQLFLFVGAAFVLFILILVIIYFVTYRVSRRISSPIHEMCVDLEKVDLEKGTCYMAVETGVSEVDYLSEEIAALTQKLQESMKHIIQLKDFELEAKLMALQTQMQPHFLVNILTTMGSMAHEAGNRDVERMCTNLNQMFRYISSEETGGVRVFEEMRHVERYAELMKERFPNSVVQFDIPLEMMEVRIPKLTIQPLVENSFKYCNRSMPRIRVTGEIDKEGRWTLKVLDNGAGFTREKAAEIMKKCEESLDRTKSLSGKIDGMGLANVYVRLKLFYKEDAVFQVDEFGVQIGGKRQEDC